jgi:hypothetical protein
VLERLLRVFDREQREWERYEEQCAAVVELRQRGADAPDPVPPSPESSVFALLRMYTVAMSADRRSETARACSARRRPMPGPSATIVEVVMWITAEAMAGGLGCDFETAHQLWFVLAELLLRDADIGAIVARVHPERVQRDGEVDAIDLHRMNIDLARKERARVNNKRQAFGYSTE